MTVTVKDRTPLIVPPSVRRRAGFRPSDKLEFKASGGVITITAKPEAADDDYTPEQRRKLLADLKLARKDIAEGRFYGPYETVDEMIASVEGELHKRAAAKKRKRTG